jgi:hypothetical protein
VVPGVLASLPLWTFAPWLAPLNPLTESRVPRERSLPTSGRGNLFMGVAAPMLRRLWQPHMQVSASACLVWL